MSFTPFLVSFLYIHYWDILHRPNMFLYRRISNTIKFGHYMTNHVQMYACLAFLVAE